MTIYENIKNTGKKVLRTSLALISLAGIANAEEIKTENLMPERKIVLDMANPVTDVEANANAWLSANQFLGGLSDYLGIKKGLDNTLLGRIGLLGLNHTLSHHLTHTSHEFGHVRVGEEIGSYEWRFEPNSLFTPDDNWTKTLNTYPTNNQRMEKAVAGLNQNAYNAQVMFKNNKNQITPDNAASFLSTHSWGLWYNAGLINSPPTQSNDVDNYIRLLNKKGIPTKKSDHLTQEVLAKALSIMPILDNARAIYDYLKTGNRITKPTVWKWGETEFTPPLINLYLTPKGGFFNATSFVNPSGEHPIEMNIGMDADPIGKGEVNTLTVGGQYNNFKLINNFMIHPHASIDLERKSLKPKGFSAGVGLELRISDNAAITTDIRYSEDDIMENTVKGKDNGYNIKTGVIYEF